MLMQTRQHSDVIALKALNVQLTLRNLLTLQNNNNRLFYLYVISEGKPRYL